MFKSPSIMPCLNALNTELLVRVLDLASDVSVLELDVASPSLTRAVEECRRGSPLGEGAWRHPPGKWEVCGLWRFLSLGDLKKIPSVTLSCKVEFQNVTEALAFFKAAKHLAADTIDGQVTFNTCSFSGEDVAELYTAVANPDGPLRR